MTKDERDELQSKARRLVAMDIDVNEHPINAPYTLVVDGTRFKVRVRRVKDANNADVLIGGKMQYRFYVEKPVEVVTSDRV